MIWKKLHIKLHCGSSDTGENQMETSAGGAVPGISLLVYTLLVG